MVIVEIRGDGIKACFEGIHTVVFIAFADFLMQREIVIVLYIDDAISTNTLNMSHELGAGIKWNRW